MTTLRNTIDSFVFDNTANISVNGPVDADSYRLNGEEIISQTGILTIDTIVSNNQITADVLTVTDNKIVLNSNVTSTPSLNASLQVERGTSTNASLLWDEASDTWKAGLQSAEDQIITATASQTLTNKSIIVNNMTSTQKSAIVSPLAGQILHDTFQNQVNFYNGRNWVAVKSENSGFKLTSTWNSFGDSYGQPSGVNGVPSWVSLLTTATGTTANNYNVGGTTIDWVFGNATAAKTTYSILVKSSTVQYTSSIIQYGENDYRCSTALYQSSWWWQKVYLHFCILMSVPWANIIDANTFSTKSGSIGGTVWVFGVSIGGAAGGYIEQANVNGRYYYVSFTCVPGEIHNAKITIGGVDQVIAKLNIPAVLNTFTSVGVLIDMQTAASRTIRITKDTGSNSVANMYVNWVASWDLNSPDMRHVLAYGIPRTDPAFDSGGFNDGTDIKHMALSNAIDESVTLCQRVGLPVYRLKYTNGAFANQVDGIHNTLSLQNMEVDHMIRFGLA